MVGLTALVLVACTEPRSERPAAPPAPASLETRLELSDSTARAGTELRVLVRLGGKSSPGVASVTARLGYDSTGLRFVAEDTLRDGATRVVNPTPGVVRFAAIAPNGFTDGQIYAVRFAVLRAGAVASLRLVVDEMHTAARSDATAALIPAKP